MCFELCHELVEDLVPGVGLGLFLDTVELFVHLSDTATLKVTLHQVCSEVCVWKGAGCWSVSFHLPVHRARSSRSVGEVVVRPHAGRLLCMHVLGSVGERVRLKQYQVEQVAFVILCEVLVLTHIDGCFGRNGHGVHQRPLLFATPKDEQRHVPLGVVKNGIQHVSCHLFAVMHERDRHRRGCAGNHSVIIVAWCFDTWIIQEIVQVLLVLERGP